MSIPTTLAKSALFGALLLGNIAPPADNYYEDDGDFGNISASLQSGWGWFKFNGAYASDHYCTGDETTPEQCGRENGGFERIPVTGTPIPTPPWGGAGGGSGGGGGTNPGDGGGSPGSGSPGVIDPKEQCEINATKKKNNCITTAEGVAAATAVGCLRLIHPARIAICEVAALVALNDQKGNCEEDFLEEKALCT